VLVRASGSPTLRHSPGRNRVSPFQYKLGGATLTASGGRFQTTKKKLYEPNAREDLQMSMGDVRDKDLARWAVAHPGKYPKETIRKARKMLKGK